MFENNLKPMVRNSWETEELVMADHEGYFADSYEHHGIDASISLKLFQVNGSPRSLIFMYLPKTAHANLTYLPQKITYSLRREKKQEKRCMETFEAYFPYLPSGDENIKWQ